VDVPSESVRWDAYLYLRSLMEWVFMSSNESAAGAPAMRV
jgi:hypothetical protein